MDSLPAILLALAGLMAQVRAADFAVGDELTRVQRAFETARQAHLVAWTNTTLAWEFGRACFDRAELATNSAERALIAEQGIAASRRAVALQPASAAAHYYLGLNLGQLARTRKLGALKLVGEMEGAFRAARERDSNLDHGGPDRCLGLLYLEAPGWPTSVGNRTKAARHLRRAVELAPDFPENRLNLLNAYLHWDNHDAARSELKVLEGTWPVARTNLVGEAWLAEWANWEKRLKRAKAKLDSVSKTETPSRRKG